MAQSEATEGGLLIIPGGYASYKVQSQIAGTAQTGVVALIGEADAGPRFSEEETLADNTFGPDQIASILAKYKGGPIVEAANALIAAANDPEIIGSVSRIVVAKTNSSQRATGSLTKWTSGSWATLAARLAGKDGNLIAAEVKAATSESLPTTGTFTLLSPQAQTDVEFRVNGGAAVAASLAAAALPSAMVTTINGLAGVAATGGASRGVIGGVAGNIALAVVSGNTVTITISGATFAATPQVGDTLYIPTGSPIAGGANQNRGSYVVTAGSTASVTATKLLDGTGAGAALTTPIAVGSVAVAATTDVQVFAPVTITLEAGDPVDGLGKSLEIAEMTSAAGLLSNLCYQLNTTKTTWVSTAASPKVINATAEYVANLVVSRASDDSNEELIEGGKVLLTLGYKGTSGSCVISNGTMTITVVGGAGTSPAAIKLADHKTIAQLCTYLNSLTGFSAAAATAALGQQAATSLDEGTFTIGTTHGAKTGRIKQDAKRFYDRVAQSTLVQLGVPEAAPKSGLPKVVSTFFLAGGAKGGTTDADILAACTALEAVRANFVVPCFSCDATDDIADDLTESTSTYTIESVNANVKAHTLKMSTFKARRMRQAFTSHRGTFTESKEAAGNMAHPRVSMAFQDVRAPNSVGTVVQSRPYILAAKTAGAQAAAFYKGLVRKGVQISGAVHADGTFDHNSDTAVEDALSSGLNPVRKDETNQWIWVSDQTTYAADPNFVWNSIQAVYVSDIVAMTAAQKAEKAIVGQNPSDMSRSVATAVIESVLGELVRLKLLAPSDDAPKGWKNLVVRLEGKTIRVSAEVKVNGLIYFVPIQFVVSAVQQA